MKKTNLLNSLAIAALVIFMSGLQSCTKLLQGLHFDLGMQTQTVQVNIPVSPAGTFTLPPVNSTYNVDSFIKANTSNQLGINNINSVKLGSCVLTIEDGDATNNFGNFSACSASFYSNTNSTPYVMSIANNPDADTRTLSLPVDASVELKSYIGTNFTYNVSGTLRRPTTKVLKGTVTITYNLVVQG